MQEISVSAADIHANGVMIFEQARMLSLARSRRFHRLISPRCRICSLLSDVRALVYVFCLLRPASSETGRVFPAQVRIGIYAVTNIGGSGIYRVIAKMESSVLHVVLSGFMMLRLKQIA